MSKSTAPTTPRAVILPEVVAIRTLLIAVGTYKRRIDEAEPEYATLRGPIASGLRSLGIVDPNVFHTLWEWWTHWRAQGLTTNPLRREHILSLFKPVIESLEAEPDEELRNGSAKSNLSFSARNGYTSMDSQMEIIIREDLPQPVRSKIVEIMIQTVEDYDELFHVAARIGKRSWEAPESSQSGTSSLVQVRRLVSQWDWYLVYDFVEQLYAAVKKPEAESGEHPGRSFEVRINNYFRHAGVGWQLQQGKITSRGSESFEAAVHRALPVLSEGGFQTAESEFEKALSNLSIRPHADLTGAIQHVMTGLECVARRVAGDSNGTLGEIISRNRDLIPRPLDQAVEKAWGYACERARHIREGDEPTRDEVELIVGIAGTVATYLSKKKMV